MKIVTVYKTGGDFTKEYVERIRQMMPNEFEFVCLSDDPELEYRVPLNNYYVQSVHWKNWWAKMEMFRPDVADDDIFYLDLDTVILGDITEELRKIAILDYPIMLSDFYFPDKLASGIMYIPHDVAGDLWTWWNVDVPSHVMAMYRGDQNFIAKELADKARRFDLLFPDWICSYKAHIKKSHPKHIHPYPVDHTKSKIVAFHGKPRIKDIPEKWDIKI